MWYCLYRYTVVLYCVCKCISSHTCVSSLQTDKYKLTATPETESCTGPPFSMTFDLTSGGGATASGSGEKMQSDETTHQSLRVCAIGVLMNVSTLKV